MSDEEALQRAGAWIAAWNSHDLERILALYEDDFRMTSPHVRGVVGEPTGTLVGKDAVRRYWRRGLELVPHMHFILLDVFRGVGTLPIYYASNVRDATVVEVLVIGESGRYAGGSAMNSCRPAQAAAHGV